MLEQNSDNARNFRQQALKRHKLTLRDYKLADVNISQNSLTHQITPSVKDYDETKPNAFYDRKHTRNHSQVS